MPHVILLFLCTTVHAMPCASAGTVSEKRVVEVPAPPPMPIATGARAIAVRRSLPRVLVDGEARPVTRRYLVEVRWCFTWCTYELVETDRQGYDAAVPEGPWPPP